MSRNIIYNTIHKAKGEFIILKRQGTIWGDCMHHVGMAAWMLVGPTDREGDRRPAPGAMLTLSASTGKKVPPPGQWWWEGRRSTGLGLEGHSCPNRQPIPSLYHQRKANYTPRIIPLCHCRTLMVKLTVSLCTEIKI